MHPMPTIFVFVFLAPFLFAQNIQDPKTPKPSESKEKEISTKEEGDLTKEEGDSENILEEFVVTATRTKKTSFDLPYSTTLINAKELRRKKPRTLPEALAEVPGVMVQKTANGQGSPFIRGFTGFRTVLLIDGIRLNNSVFREGPNQYWSTVDPLSLDHIEVVRGPASVLYGSDAVGGAVQAFTKERKLYKKPFQANGLLSTRLSSAEASSVTRVEGSANVGETFGMLVGQNYKQFGDIDAGGDQGRLDRTGYYELNTDGKFNFFINPNLELTAAYYLVQQDNIWRTHRTIFAESFRDSTTGTDIRHRFDQERYLTYLRMKATDPLPFVQNFTLTGSYHFQEEERNRLRADRRLDFEGFEVSTAGLTGQFTSDSPIGTWTYGFDYYRDFVNSFRKDFRANGTFASKSIQGPVADDATYDLLGFYIQNEVPFHQRLKGVFGVRYTHAWVDAEEVADPSTGLRTSISDDWGAFVGNAHLIATVHENLNIYGGVSQSFRAPNLSDLTRFDTARSGEVETPSPGLDPEKFLSLEVGLNTKSEWFEGHLAYYYTFVDDMIIRFPTGRLID
ncbi:MAG: TonB-dependent receptor, partial [Planctomycetota bacterium]